MPLTKVSRAVTGAFGGGLEIDAAVHCDAIGKLSLRRQASACWTFGSVSWMNSCPPKPGLTVITSSKSIWPRYGWTSVMVVGGLMARPTSFAERLDFPDEWRDLLVKFDMNDDFVRAGLAKGSIKICGREHMR